MQDKFNGILDNIEYLLIGVISMFYTITKIYKAIKIPFRKIYLVWLMKTNYDGPVPGAIRTLFDKSTVCYSHDGGDEFISKNDAEMYILQYVSMKKRMYRAGCDSGRNMVVDFNSITKTNEYFDLVYTEFAKSLKEDDLVSIWYVIPDNVPGLTDLIDKCKVIKNKNFHVVKTRDQAPT